MNYRHILDNIPTAAVVTDKKLKVRYYNRAFLECFHLLKGGVSFKAVTGCAETGECGKGERCAYCSMRSAFSECAKNGEPVFRNFVMQCGKERSNVAVSMKVTPVGRYLLGVIDNAFQMEIAKELYSAQNMQQRLLPPPKLDGVPYSFMYIPYREIGGDLPDIYRIGSDTVGFLSDVSGKGISAGILSAFVKAGWDKKEPSLAKALRKLNRKFQELNPDEKSYVTAVAVRIDERKQELCYTSAGHNAPILVKTHTGISEIEVKSPPISNWIPDFSYTDHFMRYEHGNILVLLTDGVIESQNAEGEQFSLERVEDVLSRSNGAEQFIERLKAELTEFCGTFSDDITAVAFDL